MEWSQPSSTTIFGEKKEEVQAVDQRINQPANEEDITHSSFGSSSLESESIKETMHESGLSSYRNIESSASQRALGAQAMKPVIVAEESQTWRPSLGTESKGTDFSSKNAVFKNIKSERTASSKEQQDLCNDISKVEVLIEDQTSDKVSNSRAYPSFIEKKATSVTPVCESNTKKEGPSLVLSAKQQALVSEKSSASSPNKGKQNTYLDELIKLQE